MTRIRKYFPLIIFIIPVTAILLILGPTRFNKPVKGSSDSLSVRTENDFVTDPGLVALPGEDIVAVLLESQDCSVLEKDTGGKGYDIIPYRYTAPMEQTFCWDDRNKGAGHYMVLVDDEGVEVLQVNANGECATGTVEAGDYEMRVFHDEETEKNVAVFIVPENNKSTLSTASDETLENISTFLDTDRCVGCDLSGANLYNADLSGVDLEGAKLNDAILANADLSGANLKGAELKNADLTGAKLKGAALAGADLTNAVLINSDLSDADLTAANMEGADVTGANVTDAQLSGAVTTGIVRNNIDTGEEIKPRVHEDMVSTVTCTTGAIAAGTGEDLDVTGPCTVGAGTYHYRNVHIYNGGSLTFEDAVIHFWAYNILVENNGSLIAGSVTTPIGAAGGKLTIHLYGEDQGNGGKGVLCKTGDMCGVDTNIWNNDHTSKQSLPGPVSDFFYQYHHLPVDSGDTHGYFGYKTLAVSYGGTLRLFGKKGALYPDTAPSPSDSGMSWVRLNGTVNVGATQLTVDRPVDWGVGDRIVITTTDYLPAHSEVLEIIAPPVSSTTFNFKVINPFTGAEIPGGLKYRHHGVTYPLTAIPTSYGINIKVNGQPAAETRAAVALLSRSIRIVSGGDTFNAANPTCEYDCLSSSPATYHFGGHTSVRQGAKEVKIQGVEFYQLGQGGRLGHYPVHFHIARQVPDGTFVKDSSIWDSMTRFITIHATQGVTLARNVGFMSIGHGFYLEDGTEINNKLYSNIGILARAAVNNPQNPRQVPGILAWSGNPGAPLVPYNSDIYNPTVFWIMNGWNDFEYNMAAGATGCGVCYWLLSGANSGASQGMKWESYASMQSGPVKTVDMKTYEENFGRAGMTPLKSFVGNYCTSAMMSFNTVGATDSCIGVSSFTPLTNPLAETPAGDKNMETYYPKVDPGGGRFATRCDGTDCGPTAIPNRCSTGDRSKCMVTVLDRYTSSFHWPQQNFAAIWLRPQWYLYINSFLSDVQNGGLGFVTGGDYTLASVIPGLWQLATKSVFVGHTQTDNPLSSNAGPFNPLKSTDMKISGLVCDNGDANHCRSAAEGISMPIDNFGVNQRFYNIYDGPNYQDTNAYLDITETNLNPVCQPGNCPQFGPGIGMPAWMYTRVIGVPVNKTKNACVLPNAAIGWKQPNGFFYPPAFHSEKLYFHNVDIRHYVLEPLWDAGTYTTNEDKVKTDYCTFPASNMFGNFSSVDRQTVLNDDDGSLTGLLSPPVPAKGETISVNLDPFFNAPIEATECESFNTAKTSPYEYLSTIIYPGCVGNKDCGAKCAIDQKPCLDNSNCGGVCKIDHKSCSTNNDCNLSNPDNTCDFGLNACNLNVSYWSRPCTNASCYGVPLERQLLTSADNPDLSTTGIRMAGMDLYQRSMMTLNDGVYYIDTTVSEAEQRKTAQNLNVFKPGDTYYVFFLYAKPSTKQTYQIYVGTGLNLDTDVNIVRANIAGFPIMFPAGPADWGSVGWTKNYDSNTGILTVTVDMSSFATEFADTKKDFCQPASFCTLTGDTCGCSTSLPSDQLAACQAGNICGKWAGKDIDCPKGGCLGFSFKLPNPGFVADNKGNILQPTGHRPKPVCFPNEAPWNISLTRASVEVAGSCSTTPIDNPKFCSPGVPPPPPPPTEPPPPPPPPPPGADKDNDGVGDDVDSDGDNDGIPNSMESSSSATNVLSSTRLTILNDPDGDGIPNEFDLDSDGDGIPDHFEAGGNNDANRDGLADNHIDTDGDGHHDAHDPETGGALLPLHDTDGDDIPDFLDTDSDGDGVTDTNETAGCVDADGDGEHDNSGDSNSDGLPDSVHPATGAPCGLIDSDGDGIFDHLDAVHDGGGVEDDGGGNCAIAGTGSGKGSLAGLLLAYSLIPASILVRRKMRS
ncbi:MAG: pentapeptide repeat-containing protein [Thermodesulfobacteriota bacterium]